MRLLTFPQESYSGTLRAHTREVQLFPKTLPATAIDIKTYASGYLDEKHLLLPSHRLFQLQNAFCHVLRARGNAEPPSIDSDDRDSASWSASSAELSTPRGTGGSEGEGAKGVSEFANSLAVRGLSSSAGLHVRIAEWAEAAECSHVVV